MKKKFYAPLLIAFTAMLTFTACNDDKEDTFLLRTQEYEIVGVDGSGISGKVTFTEDNNGKTEILIELTGTTTSTNPAFVRFNSAEDGGTVALTLEACECAVSHTIVSKLDGGTAIDYDGLLKLNGHISIHQSVNDDTIIGVANIGSNAE